MGPEVFERGLPGPEAEFVGTLVAKPASHRAVKKQQRREVVPAHARPCEVIVKSICTHNCDRVARGLSYESVDEF